MKFKQILNEIFPGNKWTFEEMNEKELWKYLQNKDVVDVGQVSKKQKKWLMKWIKKGLIFRHRDITFYKTVYSINELGHYLPY